MLCNISDTLASDDAPQSRPPAPAEDFDLFLLIGQSNMAGRAKTEAEDTIADPRIFVLDANGDWVCKGEPVHFDKPQWVGTGPASSFAKAVSQACPGKTIGLIPCAVGNTALDRWVKGGDLYESAVRRGRLAMRSGALRGILWHQGESDSGDEVAARTYGVRLAQMITDLRSELGVETVPFYAGLLGDFITSRTDKEFPHAEAVNAGIRSLPERVPNTFVVSTAGLGHRGDAVHFDGPAARELGRRYAESYLNSRSATP